ncbi:MAG: methyltransferase domain-containing protein [Chloroflexota bacterium]
MPDDAPAERTTATYDQIAARYYERWHDRSAIHQHLARFVDMMRAYGLSELPVVDVGCGPGFDAAFLRQSGLRCIGLDLSLAMMKVGRPEFGGDYVLGDMRALPLAIVGGLWVSASMLHVPRDQAPAVLRGFARVLAPGGLLYLSLKAGQGAEWTQESQGLPLSRYFVYWSPDQLDELLHASGFSLVDGWLSPVDETTSWLIRFARKATAGSAVPLPLN